MKMLLSFLLWTILSANACVAAFYIELAEAQGTVYIRADGSIDPSTAPIQAVGDLYTFTGDISDMIVVERDSIIIDANGHALLGSGFGNGIDLNGRANVTVQDTQIRNFIFGIRLDSSFNNSISRNTITNNGHCGIGLYSSCDNNSVSGNNIIGNYYGIGLYSSSNNSISENNMTNNYRGIMLEGSGGSSNHNSISENNITNNDEIGIFLHNNCFNNAITGNNMTANTYDCIRLDSSFNNIIGRNTIADSIGFGIWLYYSSDNRFYHNNFIDNTQQVNVFSPGCTNVWDDGYPSGGNYWSDYNGTDADYDGIGDTPYFIDANNQDNHPLMGTYSSFDTPYGCVVDFVSNSSISDASFDLSYTETHPEEAMLGFNVSGGTSTKGFLRVCIPRILINGSYLVMFDGLVITNATYPQVRELPCSNETYEYLYINYTCGEHKITITGTTMIPELPLFLILLLLKTAILLAAIVHKKNRNVKWQREHR